jgi:hypothetical protein
VLVRRPLLLQLRLQRQRLLRKHLLQKIHLRQRLQQRRKQKSQRLSNKELYFYYNRKETIPVGTVSFF